MDKILDFLANNYIYFLIGAGVLFFALIGFIVDLKKRNKSEGDTGVVAPEVPIEAAVPATPVVMEPIAQVETPVTPLEEYRPVPPMPEVQPEVIAAVPTPVQPVQMPTAPVQGPVQETPKIEIEEL